MADSPEEKADAAETPPEPKPDELAEASGAGKLKQFIVLCAGVVAIAAGTGYGVAMLGGCGDQGPATPAEKGAERPAKEGPNERLQYIDLDPITVNLDEPRLARYVRVTVTLAVANEQVKDVQAALKDKMPVLKNWLNSYFMSCTLEEVRGAGNVNRMQREILDAFNGELWPDQKPRISHVLFKEFTVT